MRWFRRRLMTLAHWFHQRRDRQLILTAREVPMADQSDSSTASSGGPPRVRIFIALKMAPEIAGQLAQMALELERFPVRLIAPADIHLTLVPPWNEVSMPDAVVKLHGVADRFGEFVLKFRHVGYGPEPGRPRFLWAECDAGPELARLRAALLLTFGQSDERPFRPHVTLARLRGNGVSIARKCPVDRALALTQRVGSVELMQSPAPGESGYKMLASLQLGADPDFSKRAGRL
ncbi:2'-5' RNA ligase family protein [Bradyrhizobium sediminis]|uniref:RNA 2',3'-cyclic phosphodiesterase n=1 Tax=Bradyrhizobium sediminis TaxID=2840469 RepID=A0A975NMS1_9BRAD|nr:2'-5' RNA ligase family protein [Bradyrhizobium sediminis]QWG17705.1 2'-5' RNA ligase family protein [Bradyrhizobium sediminis]